MACCNGEDVGFAVLGVVSCGVFGVGLIENTENERWDNEKGTVSAGW